MHNFQLVRETLATRKEVASIPSNLGFNFECLDAKGEMSKVRF